MGQNQNKDPVGADDIGTDVDGDWQKGEETKVEDFTVSEIETQPVSHAEETLEADTCITKKEKSKENQASNPASPRIKHTSLFSAEKKDLNISLGAEANKYETSAHGPNRVKRLFRRRSSTRVCPDLTVSTDTSPTETCKTISPSPTDTNKNHRFMFSGTLSPVPLRGVYEADEGFLSVTQLYNSMNDGQLSQYLFDPTYMLIVDTRGWDDYDNQHIVTAFHVSELYDAKKVDQLSVYTMIILYDCKGLSHSLKDSGLSSAVDQIQSDGIEPFILTGGFDMFHSRHPYMCTKRVPHSEIERQMLIRNLPSIIVEDQLLLGRGDQATNPHVISDLGITHIVNVTKEHRNAFEEDIKYLTISLEDENTANLLKEFPATIEFIMSALSDKGNVLIHCNLGVSRSATITIAYLMYLRRWSLLDAHHYVRERRPIIHPNRGFINQLSRFEETLFGRKLTSTDQLYNTPCPEQ